MSDPLHFAPVKSLSPAWPAMPEPAKDSRGFFRRLFSSIRPTAGTDGTDRKTGKTVRTVGIKGGTDF
jgi:hypothetical protein